MIDTLLQSALEGRYTIERVLGRGGMATVYLARGVIHRDLKPENILFQAGQPVVADFGIALAVSNAGGTRVTQTGLSLGTPQYMSPEQATGDRTIDARADIYALGAVTYEMLSGEPPFTGTTAQAIIARLMTTDPQSLTIVRRNVPPHVAAAVHHALEKLPADRFDSAKAFAEALSNSSFVTSSPGAIRGAPARNHSVLIGGLAVACAAATAVAAWGWLRPAKPADAASARFSIEMPKGVAFSNVYAPLTITHDGRTVIFRGVVGDSVMLLRRDVDQLDAIPIPGTLGGERAAVSPDDKWIAYERASQVYRVPLSGGSPVSIARGALAGLSWVTNDQIIAAEPNLVVISTNGTTKTILAPDPKRGEILLRWPHVLPDGNTVLYVSWPRNGLQGARIGVLSLATGKSKVLDLAGTTPLGVMDGSLFYVTPTGVLSAVPFNMKSLEIAGSPRALIEGINMNTTVGASRAALAESGTLVYIGGGSTMQLVLLDPSGTVKSLFVQNEVNAPTWSPDGKYIAVLVTSPQGKVEVGFVDATTGAFQRVPGDGNNRSPSWSPDGKRIMYVSNRDGSNAVWWQPIDGSGVAEKIVDTNEEGEATLSPDGNSVLLLTRSVDGKPSLWSVDLKNSMKKTPLVDDPTAIHPAVTPDGKWLAYESRRTGRPEVFIRPFGGGTDRQISLDGGSVSGWSPDGRTLYYSPAGRQVVAASIQFGSNVEVVARRTVFHVPFPVSPGASSRSPLSVAPDGKRLATLTRTDVDTKIVVITNWLGELRRNRSADARR
jgi:dipeptidyl aminopeptidase/acylaminoacyl peptidase